MDARMKFPSADHLIDLKRHAGLVTVVVGDIVLAESRQALVLREAAYAPVFYFPREAVAMTLLERQAHTTHCPYKGQANAFSAPQLGEGDDDVAWSYEAPYPSVAEIVGHTAFYASRVSVEAEAPPLP
jgi:uncharacterized protein (DUF427 family)